MPRRLHFRDLSEFRHLYWGGLPEARIARCLKVDRDVVRRIIKKQGLDLLAATAFILSLLTLGYQLASWLRARLENHVA